MLKRCPELDSGERHILSGRRRELSVNEPWEALAIRASTSSSRSTRQTFQLENTTVQTSEAMKISIKTTRKTDRRVLLHAQKLLVTDDLAVCIRIPCVNRCVSHSTTLRGLMNTHLNSSIQQDYRYTRSTHSPVLSLWVGAKHLVGAW